LTVDDVTLQVIRQVLDQKRHLTPQGPHRSQVLPRLRLHAGCAAHHPPVLPALRFQPRELQLCLGPLHTQEEGKEKIVPVWGLGSRV